MRLQIGKRARLCSGDWVALLLLSVCVAFCTSAFASSEEQDAKKLMDDECFSCHKIDRDDVGPAWIKVAQRYHHDPGKAPYLADKILKGNVGDWGKTAMPPHPEMSRDLALYLANYVLSLNGPVKKEKPAKSFKYKNSDAKTVSVDFQVFESNGNRQVVTDSVFGGFEKYNSYCFRCHGFDAVGGEYAADLRNSLVNGLTKKDFFAVTMAGRPEKGMPAWAGFFSTDDVDQIYQYVKARSLDLIGPGRPPSKSD